MSGSKTVTAHFLVSKFGTGSNYKDATVADPDLFFPDPDPTLTFTAADLGPFTTAAWHWHLNAIASTHLCLAVEISAPGDPFVAPSLLGSAPGWPTTDLRVIFDNNKAQRNLSLSTTPARGIGGIDSYAIVHNAATFRRKMVLRSQVSPEVASRFRDASIRLIGSTSASFRPGDTIEIPDMQPGENRWVGLSITTTGGKEGDVLPVEFQEMVGDTPVNGFTLAAQLAPISKVLLATLEVHRSVLTRLAAGGFDPKAQTEADLAQRLIDLGERLTETDYSDFVKSSSVSDLASHYVGTEPDLFGIKPAVTALAAAVGTGVVDQVTVAHTALLNRLDSLVTQRALANGDVADILQMARWQSELYNRMPATLAPACTSASIDQSRAFIALYQQRKAGAKDYLDFIKDRLTCFHDTARNLGTSSEAAEKAIASMESNLSDATAVERAHRDFLLVLQDIVPPPAAPVAEK